MKDPTVAFVAAKFGVTEEQVRAQYRRNAAKIRKEAARIRAGGQNPNDFNPDYLDEKAKEYDAQANSCPTCGGGHPVGCCAQDGHGG